MLTKSIERKLNSIKEKLIRIHEDIISIDSDLASHVHRVIDDIDEKIESGEVRP